MAGEWSEVSLEEVSDEITVGHVGSMASEYVETGIPFLRSLNVEPFRINQTDIRYITPKFHARLKKSTLRPGDVVIVRTGKPGATTLIPEWLSEANCSDLVIVRPGKSLDRRFLVYYMNSVAQHHVSSHLVGAVQQHFNVGSARQIKMLIPPLPEQQAIAAILGSLDDKIELNRRMNETLEGMARALFKSWFVDFDPVRAKAAGREPQGLKPEIAALFPAAFEDSELGEIPQGWRVGKLGDCVSKVSMGPFGSSIKTDNFVDHGVPIIRGSNLTKGFVEHAFVYLTESKADELKNANAFPGDIVITHRGTLGQIGLIPARSRFRRYVVSQSQMLVRADLSKLSSHYLYLFLTSPQGQLALLSNTSQTGVPAIAQPTASVKALSIIVPEEKIVANFENVVGSLFESNSHIESQSKNLAALRDTLLPKLISGELRVPDAERIVGRVV